VKPLDPRLLRYARSTRGFVVLAVGMGIVMAILVIIQARLLATAIVDVAQGRATLATSVPILIALAATIAVRAIVSWIAEAAAYRTSAKAKAELRAAAMDHVLRLGPHGPAGTDPGGVASLLTRGVDALDTYFARYLPQLFLALIVPAAIIATVIGFDLVSAIIIAVTLPIIVVFMILIGLYTRSRVDRQWQTLARLSGHFLDLVAGLPTLKVLGRAKTQAQAIEDIGDRYRSTTMGVLRISFLSSFALELLASLSVALVAVTIGVRLVEGGIAFSTALFVLILAPEAYLPLRMVGQHFHAAAEGLGAADEVFTILEIPLPSQGSESTIPQPLGLRCVDVTVTYPDRDSPALFPTTVDISPGSVTALIGTSGGGKSTFLAALLGFVAPTGGVITVRDAEVKNQQSFGQPDIDLRLIDPDLWRARVAWVPQSPQLVAPWAGDRPTVLDVVRLGRPDATSDEVRSALAQAGVLAEIEAMPEGMATQITEGGVGLSAGQVRRLALARALLRKADLLLLDEPTAALDGVSEAAVVQAIRAAADSGVAVVVVAHRPALIDIADVIVHVSAPLLQQDLTLNSGEDLINAERAVAKFARTNITDTGW
jgi:ATP-binding cassette, subfamily C, bacterial CydCD